MLTSCLLKFQGGEKKRGVGRGGEGSVEGNTIRSAVMYAAVLAVLVYGIIVYRTAVRPDPFGI